MVVNDFKGEPPAAVAAAYSLRTVASSQSGHRQAVPSEAEELDSAAAHELQDLPPSYEASLHHQHHHHNSTAAAAVVAVSPDDASTTSSTHGDESAAMVRRTSRSTDKSDDGAAAASGYQRTAKMTWEEKDASGYWAKYDNETGACCSRRGGCLFSDRDACCFSDRDACCFSDRDACCFSDRGACCFSDNGGCCFSDNGSCCFSGTAPGERWKPVPSFGTLFKGFC